MKRWTQSTLSDSGRRDDQGI